MKLKTKFEDEDFRLGEICEASITTERDGFIKVEAPCNDGGWHEFYYESLKDMLDEWEDAPEEPKKYLCINSFGDVEEVSTTFSEEMIDEMRKIGNYFETEEEAEKAVRKLKAWKRLKDKGLKIKLSTAKDFSAKSYGFLEANWGVLDGNLSDVFICFGGEE